MVDTFCGFHASVRTVGRWAAALFCGWSLAACGDSTSASSDTGDDGAGEQASDADTTPDDGGTDRADEAGDGDGTDDAGTDDAAVEDDGGTDAGPPVPRPDPADPHHWVWNGGPFFLAGYYPGFALTMTGESFAGDFRAQNAAVIDRLAENGINYFRVWANWGALPSDSSGMPDNWDRYVRTPYERTGPGTAADGSPRLDLDRFDDEFFAILEHAVEYAGARGIVVQLILLDCWHAGFGLSWGFRDIDFFVSANNVNGVDFTTEDEWFDVSGPIYARNLAFVAQVVDRVGDNPNIVWETCNEKRLGDPSDPVATASDPFHVGVAEAVRERERVHGWPEHLVIPVDLPEHRTVAGHRTPTNGSGGEESVEDMHRRLADEQFGWNRILITDNDCCPGEPDAGVVRRKAWAALTAGAYVDVFNNEAFAVGVLDNANTREGLRWVGYLRLLLEERRVDLTGMAPHDELVGGGAWTFARPGDEYLIYLDSASSVSVGGLSGAWDAVWFDPRSGTTQPATGGPDFTAPGGGDWALHIRATP